MNLSKHLYYLKNDPTGELSSLSASFYLGLYRITWTLLNRIKCVCFGITCKNNTIFIGNTLFSRFKLSKIAIGSSCIFNSSSRYNLIGVNHNCIISTQSESAEIQIGNNCGFSGTVIGAYIKIFIGNNVMCGANSTITDFDWHTDDKRSGEPKEVIIEDNVWIGVNCIVLKGVRIGKNTVIGANSVVTKNIPENCVAAGNPCKIIKK